MRRKVVEKIDGIEYVADTNKIIALFEAYKQNERKNEIYKTEVYKKINGEYGISINSLKKMAVGKYNIVDKQAIKDLAEFFHVEYTNLLILKSEADLSFAYGAKTNEFEEKENQRENLMIDNVDEGADESVSMEGADESVNMEDCAKDEKSLELLLSSCVSGGVGIVWIMISKFITNISIENVIETMIMSWCIALGYQIFEKNMKNSALLLLSGVLVFFIFLTPLWGAM